MPRDTGGRLDAPAFHRNKDAILEVLRKNVKSLRPGILEVASGTGQHAVYFAEQWPQATWWPSDIDPQHIASIDAWARHAGVDNIKPAQVLDVTSPAWLNGEAFDTWTSTFDAILVANMIHIAPWQATVGLTEGAAKRLAVGGALLIYGPFTINGAHTAPSNQAFDESLKSQDPDWGVRDVSAIKHLAHGHGLELAGITEMPANNLTLILRQRQA